MVVKFIFPLLFLFTAIAAEEKTVTYAGGEIPLALKLGQGSIPMPRPIPGKPLLVKISAEILTSSIDEEKQEFETTFFFRQEWKDPRLAFDSKDKEEFRRVTNPASIWTPDLFFVNDLTNQTNHNGKNNSYIKHFPDGRVHKSERKTFKTFCPINLTMYPFDKQTCQLQVESYKHTIQDIIIQWNESDCEPAVTERLLTHNFITNAIPTNDVTKFRDTVYSSPRIVFSLSRTPTGVIFRVILPIIVITLCSWTSYLLSREEIGVRISLCISPIMTYLLQINFCVAFFVSPVYLTGLDVWAGTSFIVMFVSVVECVFMVYRKGPDDYWSERGLRKSEFRDRVTVALFVTGLDVLSIISVFLSRLL